MLSLLDRTLGQNHHIYQDNFYNSVRLAQTLTLRLLMSYIYIYIWSTYS